MSSINSIATLLSLSFKLYGDSKYLLYNYNKEDTISQLLKKYRLNNNLTLKQVAEKISSSPSHLCIIEKGVRKDYSISDEVVNKIINLVNTK